MKKCFLIFTMCLFYTTISVAGFSGIESLVGDQKLEINTGLNTDGVGSVSENFGSKKFNFQTGNVMGKDFEESLKILSSSKNNDSSNENSDNNNSANNGSTTDQSGSPSNGPTGDESDPLYKAMLSKTIKNSLCVKDLGSTAEDKSGDCAYINQIYGICDTHAYNHGVKDNNGDSTLREDIKNTVALKITVISQQMYKQYEYLSSTLRRLKTQLQKSVLTAQLEKAGADSGGSGSGGSSNKNSTYTNCSGKGPEDTLYCLRQNYSALQSKIGNKQCGKDEKKQLETDIDIMNGFADAKLSGCKQTDLTSRDKCSTCLGTYNIGIMKFQDYIDDRAAKRSGNYRY